jgi:hypothetical protein
MHIAQPTLLVALLPETKRWNENSRLTSLCFISTTQINVYDKIIIWEFPLSSKIIDCNLSLLDKIYLFWWVIFFPSSVEVAWSYATLHFPPAAILTLGNWGGGGGNNDRVWGCNQSEWMSKGENVVTEETESLYLILFCSHTH